MALETILSKVNELPTEEIRNMLRDLNRKHYHKEETCPKCDAMGIPRYHYVLKGKKYKIMLSYIHKNKSPTPTKNYKTGKMILLYPRCKIGELVSQETIFKEIINAGKPKVNTQ